jgi:hypothetical protein
MLKEVKDKWVEALRSGKYQQGKFALRRIDETYCCLGVLCHVAPGVTWGPWPIHEKHQAYFGDDCGTGYLPANLLLAVGLSDQEQRFLGGMNDRGTDFTEIADWIEKHL